MQKTKSHQKARSDYDQNGAKAVATALETRFAEAQARLGPQRQQLIRAILDHCEETCFLSSPE